MVRQRLKLFVAALAIAAAASSPAWGQTTNYTLSGIPTGWTVTAGGQAVTVNDGVATIPAGAAVKVTPPDAVKNKVKSVTLVNEGIPLDLSSPVVGQIIGSDGKNYAAGTALPSGVTALAMIAYLGTETGDATYTNGLAIALVDESSSNWTTAKSTCEGKTAVANGKWYLPSQTQWQTMFSANGGNNASYSGLNSKLKSAGGDSSKLVPDESPYWTSSEKDANSAYYITISSGEVTPGYENKNNPGYVRAAFAF